MFGNDDDTQNRLRKEFWTELDNSPFVMLGLQGVDNSRTRPMTAQVDREDDADKEDGGQIYFFAAHSEDLVKDMGQTRNAVATFVAKDHSLFAHIHGTLALDNDRAVIDRLWNPIIASWYKDGKDDPDLALLRFDTEKADVWEAAPGATLKAAAMKMLFNIDPGKEHQSDHQAAVRL
jgi:general stress protein 26